MLFSLSTACYALTIFDLFVIGFKSSKTSSNSINQSLHLLLLAAASIQQAAKNSANADTFGATFGADTFGAKLTQRHDKRNCNSPEAYS